MKPGADAAEKETLFPCACNSSGKRACKSLFLQHFSSFSNKAQKASEGIQMGRDVRGIMWEMSEKPENTGKKINSGHKRPALDVFLQDKMLDSSLP